MKALAQSEKAWSFEYRLFCQIEARSFKPLCRILFSQFLSVLSCCIKVKDDFHGTKDARANEQSAYIVSLVSCNSNSRLFFGNISWKCLFLKELGGFETETENLFVCDVCLNRGARDDRHRSAYPWFETYRFRTSIMCCRLFHLTIFDKFL